MSTWLMKCCLMMFAMQGKLPAAEPAFPVHARRILFLGDSITHTGRDVSLIETNLLLAKTSPMPEIINLGLPSETVSGLSEPSHPFPRPDVHERLDRALAKIEPDVVVACYGMNDGIYAPFSEENFWAYQTGIQRLIEKVHASGAKLVLMTPPPFDPLPLRKAGKLQPAESKKFDWTGIYEKYDEEVLAPYAAWIMQQKNQVEMLIDLHAPVLSYTAEQRKHDPDFTMSGDGVHLNDVGHEVLADAILAAWNVPVNPRPDGELLKLVSQKQTLLKFAWLSEVGHNRPGTTVGVPLADAQQQAAELDQKIQQRLRELQN